MVEMAVTTCGIPISFTKFPFAEGEQDIIEFMDQTWTISRRPTILAIDKACAVMRTLKEQGALIGQYGWINDTLMVVDVWHWNGHRNDELCTSWCHASNTQDPNLVRPMPPQEPAARAGQGHAAARRANPREADYQRFFNFEAMEEHNAWIDGYRATTTKMTSENFDVFLCILFKRRADYLMRDSVPLV